MAGGGRPLRRKCFAALDKYEEEIFSRLAAGEFVTDLSAEYLAEPYEEEGRGEPNPESCTGGRSCSGCGVMTGTESGDIYFFAQPTPEDSFSGAGWRS